MNRPPEILVNTGYVTDENGVLTEMVIPSNVVTQNTPSIITTYATTINWIPSNASTLVEFNAPNARTAIINSANNSGMFYGYAYLHTARLGIVSIKDEPPSSGDNGTFKNCTRLTEVQLDYLTSISNSQFAGTFKGTALESVNFPSLVSISNIHRSGVFGGVTSLKYVTLGKINTIYSGDAGFGAFSGCSGLVDVVLGSAGNPVSSIGTSTFYNCTQSGLTITIYTQGGTSLSGEPWGATNADIEYEEA